MPTNRGDTRRVVGSRDPEVRQISQLLGDSRDTAAGEVDAQTCVVCNFTKEELRGRILGSATRIVGEQGVDGEGYAFGDGVVLGGVIRDAYSAV